MEDRENIYGLAVQCPFGDECNDCPLQEIRNPNDFEKQLEIIDIMTVDEISHINEFHKLRRYEREKHIWKNIGSMEKKIQ